MYVYYIHCNRLSRCRFICAPVVGWLAGWPDRLFGACLVCVAFSRFVCAEIRRVTSTFNARHARSYRRHCAYVRLCRRCRRCDADAVVAWWPVRLIDRRRYQCDTHTNTMTMVQTYHALRGWIDTECDSSHCELHSYWVWVLAFNIRHSCVSHVAKAWRRRKPSAEPYTVPTGRLHNPSDKTQLWMRTTNAAQRL